MASKSSVQTRVLRVEPKTVAARRDSSGVIGVNAHIGVHEVESTVAPARRAILAVPSGLGGVYH